MKKVLAFLLQSCGGSSGAGTAAFDPSVADCDFSFADFLSGTDATDFETYWDCTSNSGSFDFRIFEDGNGYSTALGSFTWEQTGCQDAIINASNGTSFISNVQASTTTSRGSFTQDSPNGIIQASCTLENY